MKATKVNEYSKRNKNGEMQTNYVYKLSGTEQEIADFNASKSARTIAKEDDAETGVKKGDVLWITSNYEGETISNVVLTKSGYAVADRSEERKLVSIAGRMGKAGEKMVENYINSKLKKASVSTSVAKPAAVEAGLGDLD
jgi:hypothetical protein